MNVSGTPNPNLKLALAANFLSRFGMSGRFFANALRQLNRVLFSCDISIGARIDPSCSFYHSGLGCVIHADAVVGAECIFFQHVTLGAAWHRGGAFMTGLRMSEETLCSAPALLFSAISRLAMV